jgi:hypothetical protein
MDFQPDGITMMVVGGIYFPVRREMLWHLKG